MPDGTIIDADQQAAQTALYQALIKAQAMAKGLEKDATNRFHKYNYVSAEAMIAEAKEILAACDLALVPTGSLITDAPAISSADEEWTKNARAAAMICATWLVVHRGGGALTIESGWPVAPEKGRPVDKAVAAARTASLSYLLRDLLQIPRVEEGTGLDDDRRDMPHSGGQHTNNTQDESVGIKRLISAQLDRLGKKDAARDETVMKANGGKLPVSVADLQKVLDALKAMK